MTVSTHVAQLVARPAAMVEEHVRDYENLPSWAAGLSSGIRCDAGRWVTHSPLGEAEVRFVEDNDLGVLDHWVFLPIGERFYNPMRVLALDENTCEVVFSVRRFGDTDDDAHAADVAAVVEDLARLANVLTG